MKKPPRRTAERIDRRDRIGAKIGTPHGVATDTDRAAHAGIKARAKQASHADIERRLAEAVI